MTTKQNNTAALTDEQLDGREEAMTRKPHAVETCEDDVLTLKEIDAISGGVVRRRRLQAAARRPNLASGPTPCPFTPASVPSPCPMQPMRAPVPCPIRRR